MINPRFRKLIIEYDILNENEAVIYSFIHPSFRAKIHFKTPIKTTHLNGHLLTGKDRITLSKNDIEVGFSGLREIGLKKLQSAIAELKAYGEMRKDEKKIAFELADELNEHLQQFIINANFTKKDFFKLKNDFRFRYVVDCRQSVLSVHHAYYRVILANILIALTGFGLVAVAGKLLTSGQGFFAKTKGQNHLDKIDEAVNNFPLA